MLKKHIHDIAHELNVHGYDSTVLPDYSGRGMMGRSTVAIATNAPAILLGLLCAKAGLGVKDLPTRTDSLGGDTVYY